MLRVVIVAAGCWIDASRKRVLLTKRKAGTHLEGAWELPGGKVEPGEDPEAALVRELREEIGVDVRVGEILAVTFHRYEEAGKAVLLLFYEVAPAPGETRGPEAIDVADLLWADAATLERLDAEGAFPPADVAKLRRRLTS